MNSTPGIAEGELSPTELLHYLTRLLLRGWRLIIVLTVLAVAGVYVAISFLSYKYESTALLLVQLGRENSQAPLVVERGEVFSNGSVRKEEINSYISVLTSRGLIIQTIRSFDPSVFEFKPAQPETLFQYVKFYVKALARWGRAQVREFLILIGVKTRLSDEEQIAKLIVESLVITHEKDSNVIRLSLTLPDPTIARDFLDALIEHYLDKHVHIYEVNNIETAFRNRTTQYKAELMAKQAEMEAIKYEYDISSVAEQRSELIRAIQATKRELYDMQSQVRQQRERRRVLLAMREETPETRKTAEVFEQNPRSVLLNSNLTELRIKRAQTLNKYEAGSEIVQLLDSEIVALEALSEAEEERVPTRTTFESNPTALAIDSQVQDIDVSLAGLVAAIDAGDTTLTQLNRELRFLNLGADKLDLARIEYTVLEQKYFSTTDKLELVEVDSELDAQRVVNVSVLTEPTFTLVPAGPNKLLLLVLGIVGSLVFSVGIAFLREWLSDVVHEAADLGGLIPVLGDYQVDRYVNPAAR